MGWNSLMLRAGDKVVKSGEKQRWTHANSYSTVGLLKVAWANSSGRHQLPYTYKFDAAGKRYKSSCLDLMQSTRALETTTTVAAFSDTFQQKQLTSAFEDIRKHAVGLRFQRASDSTPWHLNFGEMVEILRPNARYFMREELVLIDGTVTERWVTRDYQEYIKRYPKRNMVTSGVLEISACWGNVTWIMSDGTKQSRRIYRPPLVLKAANSSTVHTMYRVC